MYNLLVRGAGWSESRDTMPIERMLEHTSDGLRERFRNNGNLNLNALISLPCIFMEENWHDGREQVARVGTIIRATEIGSNVSIEYVFDPGIPSFTNQTLENMSTELGINRFEFNRTHWAVKDVDLFRVLFRNMEPRRQQPRVFTISDPEKIEPTLVSAMMPFHPSFDNVYAQLQSTAESAGLRCRRADDIWENPAVIQDVVSLIDHSKVVICDCTGRNPNVFYEIGIAHTLGRETILITQSEADIPFDLRHLRFVTYLNNGEGLSELSDKLLIRLNSLV